MNQEMAERRVGGGNLDHSSSTPPQGSEQSLQGQHDQVGDEFDDDDAMKEVYNEDEMMEQELLVNYPAATTTTTTTTTTTNHRPPTNASSMRIHHQRRAQGINNQESTLIHLQAQQQQAQLKLTPTQLAWLVGNVDVEHIAQTYPPRKAIDRLIHLATHCPNLAAEAFIAALKLMMSTTLNVSTVQFVAKKYQEQLNTPITAAASEDGLDLSIWSLATTQKANQRSNTLLQNLAKWKASSIKESIRCELRDLARHAMDCGDFVAALKYFNQAKASCTTPEHFIEILIPTLEVCIHMRSMAHANVTMAKLESFLGGTAPNIDAALLGARLSIARAVLQLEERSYRNAAVSLTLIDFSFGSSFTEVANANDIAIYGTLCSLATFSRPELKKLFVENPNFAQFLELESRFAQLLDAFLGFHYSLCIQLLEELKPELLMDPTLSSHVAPLLSMVRKRALLEYTLPYSCIDFEKMANSFHLSPSQLERELIPLIESGDLAMRIDAVAPRRLIGRRADAKARVYHNVKDTLSLQDELALSTQRMQFIAQTQRF